MKKLFSLMLALALLVLCMGVCAIADDEGTEYIFEAEYTELEGLEGLGVSGSPTGLGLISENAKASNGFFVGNLGVDSPITFVITASEACTAVMKITVGSNILGNCTWNPETLSITVNGEAIDYKEFTTDNGDDPMDQNNFKTKKLGEINLTEGENVIVIVAGQNTYRSNLPSAPSIDCIKLTATAELSMEELEENID